MALTVTQCADWIRLTLGGTPGAVLPTLQLVNMAGRHLCRMTAWRWLEGESVLLDVVADQEWIALPENFSRAISLQTVDGNAAINWITRAELDNHRQSITQATDTGLMSAVVVTVAGSGETPPTARLEIHPPRASSATGFLRLTYKAKWADLTGDSNYVPIPDWCEDLYVLILQAYARGFMREEQGTVDIRLSALKSGTIFRDAIREDRTKQTEWGRIKGAIPDWGARAGPWAIPTTTTGP
jgi:hypothetical protein